MTARAPKVPANTVALSCCVARMTAMKNVLSPISLKKINRNAWRKPSRRPPVASTASVASAMVATDAAKASGATARPASARMPAAVAIDDLVEPDRICPAPFASSSPSATSAPRREAEAIHSRGVDPTISGKSTCLAADVDLDAATSRGSKEDARAGAARRTVDETRRFAAAREVGLTASGRPIAPAVRDIMLSFVHRGSHRVGCAIRTK